MLDVVFDDRICSGSAGPESSHSRGKGLIFPLWEGQGNSELGGCMSERLRGLFTHRPAKYFDERWIKGRAGLLFELR